MQDWQGQTVPESPRPVHGPWHGKHGEQTDKNMHEASKNVEQTRYPLEMGRTFW